ncbi:5'-methylthioadenosine/S-adenosylhomocysteine nucleosidase [Chitinimonas sp.]|uniref:5'-methylthioadenosine/S-adenosylhomocysteine nucleosidase n=1 Tax=Chitinimonas sp. TaxID=1934313 RepID=UPI002F93D266
MQPGRLFRTAALALLAGLGLFAQAKPKACLTECSPRIGIVSAFGAEADILVAETQKKREYLINGNRFTTGVLRGNPVVIVLSGVSIPNATMVTQLMIDHFRVHHLMLSGIAGGIAPDSKVGDVLVPERWALPMETYWNGDGQVPAACGKEGDIECLGLKLARPNGKPSAFVLDTPQGKVETGLYLRENYVLNSRTAPQGEFKFDYAADAEMLAVARNLKVELDRCGPKQPPACVDATPHLKVGGRAISAPFFLANPGYRDYLWQSMQALAVDMETAAFAHVAYANQIPYIAFRSLSDLAGGNDFREVGAFFGSGLAETNEAKVTLAFLSAWKARNKP